MAGWPFGKRVVDLGYREISYRREEKGLAKKLAEQATPGWHATPDNKDIVLGAYARAAGQQLLCQPLPGGDRPPRGHA
jgi:hypothetical protein